MIKKLLFSAAICSVAFYSCGDNSNSDSSSSDATNTETITMPDGHNSQNSLDWAGSYEGVLPCASCPGIKTLIELKNDLTFTITEEYLESSEKPTTESGTFKWNADGSSVTLALSDREVTYRVGENFITMKMDTEDSESTDNQELESLYTLRKIN